MSTNVYFFVSHRYLQKCVLCLCWELKTPLDMFRPIFFWKSSQLFVSALFPPPCRRTACRRYSPFPMYRLFLLSRNTMNVKKLNILITKFGHLSYLGNFRYWETFTLGNFRWETFVWASFPTKVPTKVNNE